MENALWRQTLYLPGEGKEYFPRVVEAVANYVRDTGLQRVLVFTSDGKGALALADALQETKAQVIAVTFPATQKFATPEKGVAQVAIDGETHSRLASKGVSVVRSTLPFGDILIPGSPDVKLSAIHHTLRLFGGGMMLCVQAVVIACDSGCLEPGEEVISVAADTAIVAAASGKWALFSPSEGMEIREIICKPRSLRLTRAPRYEQADSAEETEPSTDQGDE